MVTIEQKPIVETQKIMTKESKHTTKGNHQITKEENKRKKRRYYKRAKKQFSKLL